LPAYGQVEFGSIVGNVTDQSGGAIPGALVKITPTATNDTRSVTSDAVGAYTISTVTPGTYRVEITRDGFSTFVATDIQVNQNDVVRVNA
jgi:protocatechuate 3,4-dioxygenase beta subunit